MLELNKYLNLSIMRYKLYNKSQKAWSAMLEEIKKAQKSIYLEMYVFLDDTDKYDFIQELRKKVQAGVQVVIITDAYGSSKLKKTTIQSIRKAGIEFFLFSNWLRHIHRKILIIDERVAFIGGINIGQNFAKWNDLQIKLQGRIVKIIMKSFSYTYETVGGKNPKILKF